MPMEGLHSLFSAFQEVVNDRLLSGARGNIIGHSRVNVAFRFVSKRVLVHHLSYGNKFLLYPHCLENQMHFHMKGYASRLVLK